MSPVTLGQLMSLTEATAYLSELGLPIELTYLHAANFWTAELGGDSEAFSTGKTLEDALISLAEQDLQ